MDDPYYDKSSLQLGPGYIYFNSILKISFQVNKNILISNQEIGGYITNDLFVRNDIAEIAGLHTSDNIDNIDVKTEL